MVVTSLLLALFAALLFAASASAGSIIPLSQVCNSPNVHCIFAAKGITVTGTGIKEAKTYPEGNTISLIDGAKGSGTATGCGGSTINWKFDGGDATYDGGLPATNPHMIGYFLQNPGFILDRGHLNEQNDTDSDLGLYCNPS